MRVDKISAQAPYKLPKVPISQKRNTTTVNHNELPLYEAFLGSLQASSPKDRVAQAIYNSKKSEE